MKRDKWISFAWSCGLSFVVSFGSIACLVSAFRMGVSLPQAAFWCALSAVVCSLCYSLSLWPVPVCALGLTLGILWQNGDLVDSLEALLNRLSRQYDRAYGWGIIRWGVRTADDMEPTMILCLCILGAVIALAVAWSVCRGKTSLPGILLAMLPMGACFVVTDTQPATFWIYVTMLGVLLLMVTSSARKRGAKNGNRLCAMAVAPLVLALLLLFVLTPKDQYTGQERAQKMVDKVLGTDAVQLFMGHSSDSGAIGVSGEHVDLKSVGYRLESEAKILEVTAQFDGVVYLRGRAMDSYDGITWWDNSENTEIGKLNWPGGSLDDGGEVTVSTRYAHRMLYTPYYVKTREHREVTLGVENEKKLTEYSFSCLRQPQPAFFNQFVQVSQEATGWGSVSTKDVLGLSEHVEAWAVSTANKATRGVHGTYNKAQAIAGYVRNSASYDTQTPRMPMREKNFVRWFLEESDTGYCVHFASAAAVLLQGAGIPARYVTGYVTQVKAGQTVEVKASQAHAWVEYWLPGYGWTILEATPADLTSSQETTAQTEQTTTAEATEQTRPEATAPDAASPQKPQEKALDLTPLWRTLDGFAILFCVIFVAEFQYRLRRKLWQRRLLCADTNARAVLCWQETVRLANLLRHLPDEKLFDLAQRAKFSQHAITEDELALFEENRKTAVQQLKSRAFFRRLYYRYILAAY